jgi:hypothetical protein|tara:strand:- start:682 stop:912 length:231 start_codon:yes stop_codon:yes gene_type:complete
MDTTGTLNQRRVEHNYLCDLAECLGEDVVRLVNPSSMDVKNMRDDVRLYMKCLAFDLEATKRQRDYFEKRYNRRGY